MKHLFRKFASPPIELIIKKSSWCSLLKYLSSKSIQSKQIKRIFESYKQTHFHNRC